MDIIEIVKIGIVLTAGSIIQSSSGFGFGLFAIPLLLFLGFSLPAAVMIVVIGSAIQKIFAVIALWKAVNWKELSPFMMVGLLSLPLGVYFMYSLTFLDQSSVKQVIGFCVFVLLILQWKGRLRTGEHIHRFWGYLAGFFSGFFNGLANIGGPPLVLWILAHRWSNEKMRVTPLAFSLIFVPFQLLFMFLVFGSAVLVDPVWKAALSIPFIFAGTRIGLKIGGKISKEYLRIYMGVLLFLIALVSMIGPFFS
ncbi:MAG: sulfite exporter TauE/SafE family protein [Candidatus Aminicenantes bacterium]|nr:sulfite exporter TauE/SafE family protein [Candidatus Aminicenantes bacterium]